MNKRNLFVFLYLLLIFGCIQKPPDQQFENRLKTSNLTHIRIALKKVEKRLPPTIQSTKTVSSQLSFSLANATDVNNHLNNTMNERYPYINSDGCYGVRELVRQELINAGVSPNDISYAYAGFNQDYLKKNEEGWGYHTAASFKDSDGNIHIVDFDENTRQMKLLSPQEWVSQYQDTRPASEYKDNRGPQDRITSFGFSNNPEISDNLRSLNYAKDTGDITSYNSSMTKRPKTDTFVEPGASGFMKPDDMSKTAIENSFNFTQSRDGKIITTQSEIAGLATKEKLWTESLNNQREKVETATTPEKKVAEQAKLDSMLKEFESFDKARDEAVQRSGISPEKYNEMMSIHYNMEPDCYKLNKKQCEEANDKYQEALTAKEKEMEEQNREYRAKEVQAAETPTIPEPPKNTQTPDPNTFYNNLSNEDKAVYDRMTPEEKKEFETYSADPDYSNFETKDYCASCQDEQTETPQTETPQTETSDDEI